MKIFSNDVGNELLFIKAIKSFKFEMPYQSFEEIFSKTDAIKIEKFNEDIWKLGESIFSRPFIISPFYSASYVKLMANLPMLKRETFSIQQKNEALEYVEEIIKKSKIVISPDDINSIYATRNISGIAQFDKAWKKLDKFKKISIEESYPGDIFKIYIIKGQIAGVYGLLPAFIKGDGISTVSDLIARQNVERDKNILYKDHKIKAINSKISKDLVLKKGEILKLKSSTKIENGAVLVDLTSDLKEKFDGLVTTFDIILKNADYLVLTCLSNDFKMGYRHHGFIIRETLQSSANFAEFLSCADNKGKINEKLSFFRNDEKKEQISTFTGSKLFTNQYLKSAKQTDILKEAAYRKGLYIKDIEPNAILLEDIITKHQVTFHYGMSNKTNIMTRKLTNNKFKTKYLLERCNINTPKGFQISIDSPIEAWNKSRAFNSPIVVKPLEGSGGAGVSTYISTLEDFNTAWDICKKLKTKTVLIEECVSGNDYRVVVIKNKVCAVTQRVAAYVIGDGINTIDHLIKLKAEKRKSNPFFALKKFKINPIMNHYLSQQGLTVNSVPRKNEIVQLLDAVNIGSGGESIDRTNEIHHEWLDIAVNARKAVLGPFHVGLDLMAEDISKSPHEQKWSIIEVNTNPDLGLQVFPEVGEPRDIATSILDNLFGDIKPNTVLYSFSIYGKVQDVGFRKWLKEICDIRSVVGIVSNNESKNQVDVKIKGPEATVEQILELCYQGPKNAKVEKLCFNENDSIVDYVGFEIVY